jgi:HSP90 family molecular chaperone
MTVYDCLAEFIANSFDWCITKKNPDEKTIIQILLNPNSIEIVDNGVGMNLKELASAINIAESSDLCFCDAF